MKFDDTARSRAPALALTSMLDVIFLLLCFFVTVSVFSQWESEISIKLPTAATGEQPERLPGEFIVNLSKDGTVRVNGTTLTLDDLQSRLAKISKFYPGSTPAAPPTSGTSPSPPRTSPRSRLGAALGWGARPAERSAS